MDIELYSYQKKALEKLRSGSVLVGGVGSGKSITSLAFFYNYICHGDYKKLTSLRDPKDLYIITTARKRDTFEWHEECARFNLSTNRDISVSGVQVIIDSWNNIQKYMDVEGAFFIFDEQRLVGSGAWVKAFLRIVKKNQWILLSATPGDTWSDYIPIFIANGYVRNRTTFFRTYAVFDRFAKYPRIIKYVNVRRLENIRNKLLVVMNQTSENTRHIIDVKVGYDSFQYSVAFKDRWDPYKDEPIQDAGQMCHVLRKIVNTDKSRLNAVIDLVKTHAKLIIFYNLDAELEQLRSLSEWANMWDILIAEWNGHKHEPLPESDRWIYLVQYTAGAEGWNCRETDTVIFYSLNYSYKIMEQASGRIDRVNNHYHELYYYRFISESSIDKAILRALKNKHNFNEKMFVRA